ncbi:MAG: dual specificity protein phosphatase family protein [Syntrophobacteraceae bacterium]
MSELEPSENLPLPFSNSYWVVPGSLLAGGYPGRRDPDEVWRNLVSLTEVGIQHIISLMEQHEVTFLSKYVTSYESEMGDILRRTGRTLTFNRIPIEDMGVPSPRSMIEILDEIDDSIVRGRPVFVHCLGGRGRTGTVVGCYLVRHGMEGKQALAHIQTLRQHGRTAAFPSPETRPQRDMVLEWNQWDRRRPS